mgnify:CR=1 FL=1
MKVNPSKKVIFVSAIISLIAIFVIANQSARGDANADKSTPTSKVIQSKPKDIVAIKITPKESDTVPITLPTIIHAPANPPPAALPAEMMIINRRCRIEKDPAQNWWSIPDPYAGKLYLLPCELLQAIEKILKDKPAATFSLSGEVHRYRGGYYLLIRRAILVQKEDSTIARKSPSMTTGKKAHPTTTRSTPATHPAKKSSPEIVSPDEIARELLRGTSAKPIVPTRHPNPAALKKKIKPAIAASGVRVRKPIKAKAGRVIADRLIRLLPPSKQCRWYKVAFKGDNTLREPPMRVLPNRQLERMRALSKDGEKPGVLFYISGEVHQYHGENYILIRSAVKKRNLDLF